MEVKKQVARMVERLTHFHWSPNHPSTYTLEIDGSARGIGKIADKNYGAFNLAWGACKGKWQTKEDQHSLVTTFSKYQPITSLLVNGEPVGDWTCLLPPQAFYDLVSNNTTLSGKDRHELMHAAMGAMHVQHV